MDVQRFIQVFGGMILHSTPHLYVSVLPFSPANSLLSRKFSVRFPNTLRVASGRDINWPAVQTALRGHTYSVLSVSFSPDGTRIVTGSGDNTVRLWNAGTGEPVGEPLRGHAESVTSVSFSPDGTRIVTGSDDNTVRLCDAVMSQPSQYCAVSDPSASSNEHRVMHPTPMTLNTWNNHTICFSSNSIHALRNTSELTDGASHDDRSSNPFVLNVNSGWVAGPKHRLLFWVPPASRHPFYNPVTTLVIPRGGLELDLSRMVHGQHWQKCREVP
ncbi:WD40-repeat-containing domain protein [Suillus subaureus]|uniref:WD40-repeat-containing domain protein n=1 Tax=Suillus subaureus TaxID=48587 RepID=A0A9P7EAF7_9AGAM|nr:WD40-repeat-containing domain protein [Suillus subaureus]KAG1815930.1 WD40-repeat-containing domain protein [Suillus subaureus]